MGVSGLRMVVDVVKEIYRVTSITTFLARTCPEFSIYHISDVIRHASFVDQFIAQRGDDGMEQDVKNVNICWVAIQLYGGCHRPE